MLISILINNVTDGILNTFVVALIFGIALRTFGIFKPSVLAGIDALGLMMIAIMILVFGPLATVEPADVASLAFPLLLAFVFGVAGIVLFAALTGKLVGYTVPDVHRHRPDGPVRIPRHDDPVPGSRQRAPARSPEEVAAIEEEILPKMIVAGFSTVTITSVIVTEHHRRTHRRLKPPPEQV